MGESACECVIAFCEVVIQAVSLDYQENEESSKECIFISSKERFLAIVHYHVPRGLASPLVRLGSIRGARRIIVWKSIVKSIFQSIMKSFTKSIVKSIRNRFFNRS